MRLTDLRSTLCFPLLNFKPVKAAQWVTIHCQPLFEKEDRPFLLQVLFILDGFCEVIERWACDWRCIILTWWDVAVSLLATLAPTAYVCSSAHITLNPACEYISLRQFCSVRSLKTKPQQDLRKKKTARKYALFLDNFLTVVLMKTFWQRSLRQHNEGNDESHKKNMKTCWIQF